MINIHIEKNNYEAEIVKDDNRWAICRNDTLDKPISVHELCIYRLTNKLNNKKARALDSLTNEIIKVAFKTLPCYFTKLFNTILSHGIFPSSWTKSFIVPITNQVILLILITIEEYASVAVWENY